VTPSVSSKGASVASETDKGLTASTLPVYTPDYPPNDETRTSNALKILAAALAGLSVEDKARLAAMLLQSEKPLSCSRCLTTPTTCQDDRREDGE
jgi:hypothetical protein